MDGNLYYNSAHFIYLRIDNIYYKREMINGWKIISESELPNDVRWAILQQAQINAYEPALVEAGLIKN